MSVRYIVIDEHTLAYVYELAPAVAGILAGDVFKGGHNPKNGVVILSNQTVRDARPEDFVRFKVQVPPDFTP